ncbi:type IV pilin protein [Luteimonas sp. A501]
MKRTYELATTGSRSMGFTLIELMVTVAIVAILAAIAVPNYQEQVRKARRGQAQADLVELAQRAERHHTVNNTYETFWATVEPQVSPRDGTAYYNLNMRTPTANTFVLTATPISTTPQVKDRCGTMTMNQASVKTHSVGSDSDCRFGSTP